MYTQTTLNCRGKLLDLESPVVMGIINLTPDSFFDGGRYLQPIDYLKQVEKMLEEGAKIIDVGGMSSRPGAEIISPQEEARRIIPALKEISKNFPEAIISVDTIRSEVAKQALEAGAHLVNDISAGRLDPTMYSMVGEASVPYILMHMQGLPANMQDNPSYQDILVEIIDFFIREIAILRSKGVIDIIIDPGLGFGKTIAQNFYLLQNLSAFKMLECPVMVGLSRKSMIYKTLEVNADEALNGTTALHMAALLQGASVLRVHDVKEAIETIELWKHLKMG